VNFPKISSLVLFSFLFFWTVAWSQQTDSSKSPGQIKIGYVDTGRLKEEYKEYATIKAKFEKQMARWQAKADSLQNEVLQLQDDLNKKKGLLREDESARREEEILAKQSEYQEFAQKILGPEGEAAKKEFELSKPLVDKINAAIKLVALREGFTYVLDTAVGAVLYAPDDLDLTALVLAELNTASTK
jgi:outer membrane protein